MNNKSLFTLVLLVSICIRGYTQPKFGEQNPVLKSPNAAAIDKYGDYSVSLHSGIPDITIPIFVVKTGELTLPITLSYHASGIKPTDVASWVGLGWSLSTGGSVSRNILGKADEDSYITEPLLATTSPTCTNFSYLEDISKGTKDGSPDIYSYSIPGRRGKFLRLQNATAPFLIPYAPIEITWPSANEANIVDENGVIYRFGTGTQGTGLESTSFTGSSGTSAWQLMDMLAPNSDDNVQWKYQPLGTIMTDEISWIIDVKDLCDIHQNGVCGAGSTRTSSFPSQSTQSSVVQFIYFEGGSIEFVLSASNRLDAPATATKYLDYIDIKDSNGALIKKVKFNYSYFTSVSSANQALKLNSVEFKDSGSTTVQKYFFSYFTDTFSWNTSLANFRNARDLWGYYNGATQNTDLIVQQQITFKGDKNSGFETTLSIGGAIDRNVNTTYSNEGVLKRIDFPTGGSSEFEYEQNKYDDNGTAKYAGGLRVAKIKTKECLTCSEIIKTYKYGWNESGYGSPNWDSQEYNYFSKSDVYASNCGPTDSYANFQRRVFFSRTAYSLNSFDASPISYKYVREIQGDVTSSGANTRMIPGVSNNNIVGYTDYVFDKGIITNDQHKLVPNSNKVWIENNVWKRGFLTSKAVFDNANNKLSETTTDWSSVPARSDRKHVGIGVHAWIEGNDTPNCAPGNACSNNGRSDITFGPSDQGRNFYQDTGVFLPTVITETNYQRGSTTKFTTRITTTTYHDIALQPTSIETNRVGSEKAVTMNLYPISFANDVSSASSGNAQGIYMLNVKNILTMPVETWSYVSNVGTNTYTGGTVTTFKRNPNNSAEVVPDQIYSFEGNPQGTTTNKIATTIDIATGSILMDPKYIPSKSKITFSSFDTDGNLLQMSKTGNIQNSYLYGYANSLPVAEAKNAQNILTITPTTSETTVSVFRSPGPSNGTGSATYTFTTQREGTVDIKIDYTNGDTGGYVEIINSTAGIFNTTNTFLTKNGTCLSTTFKSVSNVPPGTYTLTVNVTSGGTNGWTICGKIYYPTTSIGGTKEIYYEGFEEHPSATTDVNACHTGRKYYAGDFSVVFTPPNGDPYIIEYWYLNSGVWTYITKAYTGNTTLTEGTAIDDVRIYPARAQMKSYTYNTINGMTSSIDENGTTLIYEYDSFGRLYRVKNDKGGIEKQYTYNYNNGN